MTSNAAPAIHESKKDYEKAWKPLKDRNNMLKDSKDSIPTLAPTTLTFNEALRLFNLQQDKSDLWANDKFPPVPQYLEDNILRIYAVTQSGLHHNNEAFSRMVIVGLITSLNNVYDTINTVVSVLLVGVIDGVIILGVASYLLIDQILICCIYEEGNGIKQQPKHEPSNPVSHAHPAISEPLIDTSSVKADPAMLELQHETPLSRRVSHNGETKLLTGFADYTIWYDSAKKNTLTTNLVIIEARRRYATDQSLPQLAAYMGVIHAYHKEEKRNSIVYGVVSDGIAFRFCRIDNNSVWASSRLMEWDMGDAGKTYSIIRSLIRAAALLSPSTSPIKDPIYREVVLASFGSPYCAQKFDYGMSELQVVEEDEETDIVGWDE